MIDVSRWLADQGLGHHAERFAQNGIAGDILRELTDADLRELGLSLGDRKRLLTAIAALNPRATQDRAAAVEPRATPAASRKAERRQLTVMFVDLVGSTELSRRLDPEDMGEVMRAYQKRTTDVLRHWGGHIANYMGDGVLACFGWPLAHEDDAERAVRAGLELNKALGEQIASDGTRLAIRIGIATGQVVVGDLVGEGWAHEEAVVGETPNLAARLQALAAPGRVVISQATRRLVGGLFELADLGPQHLKGFAEPIRAFLVEGEGRAEGRFEALHGAGVLPLVGREQELALLLDRWELAKVGEGQVVLLSGEPGIGKSRITLALRERLRAEQRTSLRYFCSPYHTNSALYPVIAQLERAADFTRDDPSDIKLAKLEALLADGVQDVCEARVLIAGLLAIPIEGRAIPELTPQQRRARTFAALLAQLEGLAARQPVLMILEDAHWLDPTGLELFALVIDRIQHLPVLLVVTHRPEFEPPWHGYPHVTTLTLNRLARAQAQTMIDHLTGGRTLPEELATPILAKTEGVPLFVEELTKTVLESGLVCEEAGGYVLAGPLPPLAIPATLQDSLMARFDRLGSVKDIAQIGAVIGREFSYELLAAVAERPEAELRSALDHLESAGLIVGWGDSPKTRYSFKHALLRDAAYESILKRRRRILHGRIAALLERSAAAAPDLLAQHLAGAGMRAAAARAYARAAQANVAKGAGKEAIAQLAYALRLLEEEPKGDEYVGLEADLLVGRGDALRLVQGTAALDTGAAYRRARELSDELKTSPALSKAIYGECLYHYHRAELREAHALALRLLEKSAPESNPMSRELGLEMAALTSFSLGALTSALGYFEQLTATPRSGRPPQPVVSRRASGSDIYLACTLLLLGYPAQARMRTEHAIAGAEQTREPFAIAVCVGTALYVFELLRDHAQLRQSAERLRAAAEAAYLPHWALMADWFLALVGLNEGDVERAIPRMRAGIKTSLHQGCILEIPFYLALLADPLLASGHAEEASAVIEEALERSRRTAERWVEPELYRRRAQLRLTAPLRDTAKAVGDLVRSLETARAMKARLWELRAARDLARLWAEQGERQKAHDLLVPVYDWFTEGFDSADLKEAKVLLDELA